MRQYSHHELAQLGRQHRRQMFLQAALTFAGQTLSAITIGAILAAPWLIEIIK